MIMMIMLQGKENYDDGLPTFFCCKKCIDTHRYVLYPLLVLLLLLLHIDIKQCILLTRNIYVICMHVSEYESDYD